MRSPHLYTKVAPTAWRILRITCPKRQIVAHNTGLLNRASEGSAYAEIADIKHENRSIGLTCSPPLGDQPGDAFDATDRFVVVERCGRVFRGRADADEIGVDVVGVQDGESLHRLLRCRGPCSNKHRYASRRRAGQDAATRECFERCGREGLFLGTNDRFHVRFFQACEFGKIR